MAGIGAPRFFVQDDGAKLAYEVLGPQHIRRAQPLVLVGGLSSLRGDWERLALCLANDRPGEFPSYLCRVCEACSRFVCSAHFRSQVRVKNIWLKL